MHEYITTLPDILCNIVAVFSDQGRTLGLRPYPLSPSLPHIHDFYLVLIPHSSWRTDVSLRALHNDNTSLKGR
ncbi:uncharacterized protein LACBIDRAFT_304197 [Laccaria bicolor S238N-H82]|uniref:Predicted protein n=1 Tax=Laccaria bicolor (strain S238N-H82 / ATCC MYA-4686) TaxID=486041 RepID=B0E4B8_LACBS|nr:uncharacterized protein LACBIDRAFT_304197 [Laccaria bicolor S238N-H82]EDQ98313.1 predicted protein [Laccaria bicolor S238N-H82]|eukprot:XP_001891036.1 predicted protein [Laccaria bicolor S238N-H82]